MCVFIQLFPDSSVTSFLPVFQSPESALPSFQYQFVFLSCLFLSCLLFQFSRASSSSSFPVLSRRGKECNKWILTEHVILTCQLSMCCSFTMYMQFIHDFNMSPVKALLKSNQCLVKSCLVRLLFHFALMSCFPERISTNPAPSQV